MAQNDGTPTAVIARRVRQLRDSYQWSAERLAKEMTQAGAPWDRTIVANLENGRRGTVSVAELLALGYVLDVPPVSLLAPLGENDTPVTVLPGLELPPYELRAWLIGSSRLGKRVTPENPDGAQRWLRAVRPIRFYEGLAKAETDLRELNREVRVAKKAGDPARLQEAEAAYLHALADWVRLVEAMRENGMRPWGGLAPRWIHQAHAHGFLLDDEEDDDGGS